MRDSEETKWKCGLRSLARFHGVQIFYRSIICNQSLQKLIDESSENCEVFVAENICVSKMDYDFFKKLLITAEKHVPAADAVISKHLSEKWSLGRLDIVMTSILRLAITEISHFDDIPTNVILNEYIEISKAFFKKSEVAFVNGLLNEAAKEVRSSR